MKPLALLSLAVAVGCPVVALADPYPVTFHGVPAQVIPYVGEQGAPLFTPGTGTFLGNDPTSPVSGSDPTSGDGSPLDAMLAQSWGAAASADAQLLGVSPSAVAATCEMESGCASSTGSGGTISGTFQMLDSTYSQMIENAEARDPSLTASVVPGEAGKLDPVSESIAASEYLREGAVALESPNIPSPTVLDVRGYYNFGPSNASAIANASDTALMSDAAPNLTDAQYKANGITPETTVGEWRATVTGKIGSTASDPVLIGT